MCGDWLDNLSLVGGYTGYRDWAEVVMTLTAERGLHRVKLNYLDYQSDAVFHLCLSLNCSLLAWILWWYSARVSCFC